MLHIIKSEQALEEAVLVCTEQDALILIEDAVYLVNPLHKGFINLKGLNVAALVSDIEARGLAQRVSPSISKVDYAGFVQLTAQHDKSLTWN